MIKHLSVGEKIYILAYAMWILLAGIRMTSLDSMTPFNFNTLVKFVNYVVIFLLFMKLYLEEEYSKENILGFVVLVLAYIVSVRSKDTRFFVIFCFIYAFRNVSLKNIMKITIIIQGLVCISVLLLCQMGIIEDTLWPGHFDSVRHSFGYDYCALLSHMILFLTMMYVYVRKKISLLECVALGFINYVTYVFVETRADLIFALLFLVICFALDHGDKSFFERCLTIKAFRIVIQCSFLVSAIVMTFLQWVYTDQNLFLRKLNYLLNGRLALGRCALRDFKFTWFGQRVKWVGMVAKMKNPELAYNTVDNSYLRMYIEYGLVISIIIMIALTLVMGKIIDDKNVKLCFILFLFAWYSSINPDLLALYYQPFILALGYIFNPSAAYEKSYNKNIIMN